MPTTATMSSHPEDLPPTSTENHVQGGGGSGGGDPSSMTNNPQSGEEQPPPSPEPASSTHPCQSCPVEPGPGPQAVEGDVREHAAGKSIEPSIEEEEDDEEDEEEEKEEDVAPLFQGHAQSAKSAVGLGNSSFVAARGVVDEGVLELSGEGGGDLKALLLRSSSLLAVSVHDIVEFKSQCNCCACTAA